MRWGTAGIHVAAGRLQDVATTRCFDAHVRELSHAVHRVFREDASQRGAIGVFQGRVIDPLKLVSGLPAEFTATTFIPPLRLTGHL